MSFERRVGAERRGTPYLPKHVGPWYRAAIDRHDGRTACGYERGPDLENELRIRVGLVVEGERSRQRSRCREEIDAWRECESPEIRAGEDHRGQQGCGSVVRTGEITLCLKRDSVRDDAEIIRVSLAE